MAENSVNPDEESAYDAGAAGQNDEYEYEYVELEEGEELPDGVEYEYVEVPSEEEEAQMPSMAQSVQSSATVQTVTAEAPKPQIVQPQQQPQTVSAPVLEPVLSSPAQPQNQNVPSAQVPRQKTVHNNPPTQNVSKDPYAQFSTSPVSPSSRPAPDSEAVNFDEIVPAKPFAEPIVEEDLNALLDNDGEIEEIDTSALLDGEDDFTHNLFASTPAEQIEEVSIDDILGAEDSGSLAAFPDDIEEISADELLSEMPSASEPSAPKFEVKQETAEEPHFEISAPGNEFETIPAGHPVVETQKAFSEPLGEAVIQDVAQPVSHEDTQNISEPISEKVAKVPEPILSAPEMPSSVIPISAPEPTAEEVTVPVSKPEAPVEEITPVSEVEMLGGTEDQVWFNDDAGKDVGDTAVPEVQTATETEFESQPAAETRQTAVPDEVTAGSAPAMMSKPEIVPEEEALPTIGAEKHTTEVVQVVYAIRVLDSQKRAAMLTNAKVVDRQSGLQFFELNNGSILLNVETEELNDWHLIIFNQNLVPVEMGKKHAEIEQSRDSIRAATVVRQGREKLEIYNEEEYDFVDPGEDFVKAQKHFIYGSVGDNTGLIVNDFVNISLSANAGKKIGFERPVFGWLSGPNGTQVYFAQLRNIGISGAEQILNDEDKARQKAAKWYSGSENDKYFEFSADSQSGEFNGREELKNIHVNIGTSSYGWNVSFDNGLVMSLKDLQEFETKHGRLPSANGEIVHGALKLKFSNVEKIVVFQTPQYFAYGRK